jgi:hypothetical protein
MNRYVKTILILVVFLPYMISASGWTQKKNSGYFQLGGLIMSGDKFYNNDGDKISMPKLTDFSLSLYAEYGVTNELTLFGSFPFFKSLSLDEIKDDITNTVVSESESKSGLSDFDIGLRYNLGKLGSTSFTAGIMFGLPVGDDKIENGLLLGDGEFNQQIFVGFGHSFNGPIYLAGKIGFNNRVEGYSDEFHYSFEAGYRVSNPLLVMFKARGVKSLNNGDAVKGGIGGLFANNQEFLAYGIESIYSLSKTTGLNAGIYSGALTKNVISALVFKAGVYYKLN